MRRWLRRGAALLLCMAALILAVSAAGSRETVYFMAVNDTPLELSAATMPTRVGGVLYVPYTVFSANYTGVNLGVYASYNSARGQVLVYSGRKQLTFDLTENLAYDGNGVNYSSRAMVRGSTVYLPVALVCSVFDDILRYSLNSTQYGMLIRVKNSSAVLDDYAFIAAAASRMSSMLTRYLQENPLTSPEPTSSPAAPSAAPSRDPVPTPSQEITGDGAKVYLAFTLTAPAGTDLVTGLNGVLSALDRLELQGLFFLTPAELTAQDDLVRRLVGSGHLMGVRLTGEGDDPQEELAAAEKALAAVAKCRPAAVLAGPPEEDQEEPDEMGYVRWRTTADGRELEGAAAGRVTALLELLAPGGDAKNYLLLDAGAGSTLRTVLEELAGLDFRLPAPVPTEL